MAEGVQPWITHDGGGVYINGFMSGPKPYEEVLTFLRKGTMLLKYGRIGSPKWHHFRLSSDDSELQWESKKGQIRRVPIACIKKLQPGQKTAVFRKNPQHKSEEGRSFSILYTDENKRERTLDVICGSAAEYEMWYWGVQIILFHPPHQWSAPTTTLLDAVQQEQQPYQPNAPSLAQVAGPPPKTGKPPPLPNLEIPSVRSSLGEPDRFQRITPKGKPPVSVATTLTNMVGGRTYAPMPTARRERRELGDLFVWGSLITTEEDDWASKNPPPAGVHVEAMRDWQQSSTPELVKNAGSVDVVRVACAPRHAALITRKGELYTWGYGKNGNLGHGWCTNIASPRLVTRMSGKGVRAVACGEGATAAISSDLRLYMWGSGSAGQLGNGYTFPCAEPAQVIFPGLREDVRVYAVSCGPYHTAAITEGGLLYTWGNGLFGKLGHGTHESEYCPRRVIGLEDKYVTSVSCGYWHTAAVAAPRSAAKLLTPFTTSITPAVTPVGALTSPHLLPVGGTSHSAIMHAGSGNGLVDGRVGLRHTVSEVNSSSGSDLQAVLQAIAAPNGSAHPSGGADHSSVGTGGPGLPLLGPMRSELLSSSVTSMEQLGAAPDNSSMAAAGHAGALYTWGGDFNWVEPSEPVKRPDGTVVPPKRDHNSGCLGLGDKEGRTVPTRVRGDLDKHGVKQVACGWSMTIALSNDGRVYQMGSTGALRSQEKSCPWEGALVPTRVDGNLFMSFVEEVACGMHHVVAVASKVQANGQMPEDQRRILIVTWGRGSEGQLGVNGDNNDGSKPADGQLGQRISQMDSNLPQVVRDGKRVLHISAGGNHSMAVVEHDPHVRRPQPAPSSAATPTNVYGTNAGTAAYARANTQHSYNGGLLHNPSLAGWAGGARDSGERGGGGLLSMTTPFQLNPSLPLTAAAAGLQSLQQMAAGVAAGVSSRYRPSDTSNRAAPSRGAARRHQSSKMVAIPAPSRPADRDLRRATTRPYPPSRGQFSKTLSMSVHGSSLEPAPSAGSSVLSHRSSPPIPLDDIVDARSLSPTSSSLYDGSVTGDFQPTAGARHPSNALPVAHPRRATLSSLPPHLAGSSDGGAGPLSFGGISITETDADTDSYYRGGRGLDMVPEQSEESPGSPGPGVRRASHMVTPPAGLGHHPGFRDSPDTVDLGQVLTPGSDQESMQPAVHPRVMALMHTSGGGASVPGGETYRSSMSTMDSSYTTGSSASPSALNTPSPETPDDAVTSQPTRTGMPGGPYATHEDSPQLPPPPLMPYGGHHPPSSPGQLPPGALALSRNNIAAGNSGHLGRHHREVSASTWSQPGAGHATAATPSAANQPAVAPPVRGEASFRGFTGSSTGDASPAAAGSEPGQRLGAAPSLGAVSPGGPGMVRGGSSARGSRGHSRHASCDSGDAPRDGIVLHVRNGSVTVPTFELAPPGGLQGISGGSSGTHTPPRLTSVGMQPAQTAAEVAANKVLAQQNELLQQQVEALRQQVTLLVAAAAAGGAAAAAAAGTAAVAVVGPTGTAGGHSYPPPLPPLPTTPIAVPVNMPAPPGMAVGAPADGTSAFIGPGSGSSASVGLPPPPLHVHHAMSSGAVGLGLLAQAGQPQLQHAASARHDVSPMMSPGGRISLAARVPLPDIQGATPPVAGSTVAAQLAGGRHRRSTSVDVSSLIATRDGIGPAREYLSAAPSVGVHHAHANSGGSSSVSSMPNGPPASASLGRDFGHHTAPPALDGLRLNHPGMSLAQAALAEAENEGVDEDDEEDGVVDAGAEGDADGEADTELDESGALPDGLLPEPGAMLLSTAATLASASVSMRRQGYPPAMPPLQRVASVEQPRQQGTRGSYEVLAHPIDAHHTGGESAAARTASEASSFAGSASGADADLDGRAGSGTGRTRRRLRHPAIAASESRPGSIGTNPYGSSRRSIGGFGMEEASGSGQTPQQQMQLVDAAMYQYIPGVFLLLRPPATPGGRTELCKVRFSRRHFSRQEAQHWWASHKAEFYEKYHVTATMGNSGGGGAGGGSKVGTPSASPSSVPTLQAPPHAQSPMSQLSNSLHNRGLSIDTQGTNVSSAPGTSMYFSIPMASPSHGFGGGSGGSTVGMPMAPGLSFQRSGGSYRSGGASAAQGPATGSGGARAGGDPYAPWADQTYSPNDLDATLLAASHSVSFGQLGGVPPRHHQRSRSGSRAPSGGAGGGPVQTAQSQWAGGRDAQLAATHAATVHQRHQHSRSRSGGAASNLSGVSSRS